MKSNKVVVIYNQGQGFTEKRVEYENIMQAIKAIFDNGLIEAKIYKDGKRIA